MKSRKAKPVARIQSVFRESSPRFDVAGPLTESVLMGNLAIRSTDIRKQNTNGDWDYPGRHIQLTWDGENMKITNFDPANQFVKRNYRGDWKLAF